MDLSQAKPERRRRSAKRPSLDHLDRIVQAMPQVQQQPRRGVSSSEAERWAKVREVARAADEASKALKRRRPTASEAAEDARRDGLAAWLKAKQDRGERT